MTVHWTYGPAAAPPGGAGWPSAAPPASYAGPPTGWGGPAPSAAPYAPSPPCGPPAVTVPGSVGAGWPGPSAAPPAPYAGPQPTFAPSPCGPPGGPGPAATVPCSVAGWGGPAPSAAPSYGAAPSAPLPSYGPPAVHGSVSAGWCPVPPPPAGPPPPSAQAYGLTVDTTIGSQMWPDCVVNKDIIYHNKLPKPCCPAYLLLTKGDPEKDSLLQSELQTFQAFVDAEISRNPVGAPFLADNVFKQTLVGAPAGPERSPGPRAIAASLCVTLPQYR
jgi:hypothetical protein